MDTEIAEEKKPTIEEMTKYVEDRSGESGVTMSEMMDYFKICNKYLTLTYCRLDMRRYKNRNLSQNDNADLARMIRLTKNAQVAMVKALNAMEAYFVYVD